MLVQIVIQLKTHIYMRDDVCVASCRRDKIAKLDPDQILDSGGSSTIRAHHLLKELAFKLGHAPKYGA